MNRKIDETFGVFPTLPVRRFTGSPLPAPELAFLRVDSGRSRWISRSPPFAKTSLVGENGFLRNDWPQSWNWGAIRPYSTPARRDTVRLDSGNLCERVKRQED
jgi:hypothetical protein